MVPSMAGPGFNSAVAGSECENSAELIEEKESSVSNMVASRPCFSGEWASEVEIMENLSSWLKA